MKRPQLHNIVLSSLLTLERTILVVYYKGALHTQDFVRIFDSFLIHFPINSQKCKHQVTGCGFMATVPP